jgi:hypothetical protein
MEGRRELAGVKKIETDEMGDWQQDDRALDHSAGVFIE